MPDPLLFSFRSLVSSIQFSVDFAVGNCSQRNYSFSTRTQSPAIENRANFRRSVRGESALQPARLRKYGHGWRLELARSLSTFPHRRCACYSALLFILILALLVLGSVALYILCEPAKLQVIQRYLKSPATKSTWETVTLEGMANSTLATVGTNQASLAPTGSAGGSVMPDREPLTMQTTYDTETETERDRRDRATEDASISSDNYTRYCDDCVATRGEVCVALVKEEVPICRLGLDHADPTGCAGLCLINKQRCHRLDVDAFRCIEVEQYCLADEWTCSNALCIPMEKRCDGHLNCYDHSDEYNCDCDLRTHFHCGNETSCLPLAKRCDGRIDCWDAADEINCILGRNLGWSCPSEQQFTCSTGQCILKVRFCDGLSDCADGSDEPHGCQGKCNKHEFMCANKRCIARSSKCNGLDDCGDGTDEKHCKGRSI